ncbi:unnamed protein product [Rotaria sp. Silwood2]|nr:unnamed protein product [Rotaria sp. Silwood2]CAF4234882.1 unnamed protein product [Rotaria sp. Silwood2]
MATSNESIEHDDDNTSSVARSSKLYHNTKVHPIQMDQDGHSSTQLRQASQRSASPVDLVSTSAVPKSTSVDELKASSERNSRMQPPNNQHSSHSSSSKKEILIYIQDLPSDLPQQELEHKLQDILRRNRIHVVKVECHLALGIAVVLLTNEEDQKYLITDIESAVFDKKQNTIISFVDDIELTSYIVIDKKTSEIPSTEKIARRWMQVCKTNEVPTIESISGEFPNIMRVVPKTLDELIRAADVSVFSIDAVFATIYVRADCSFLEYLPANITDDKISKVISDELGLCKFSASSLYVQCNKMTGNAAILTTQAANQWVKHSCIKIDDQMISKKVRLAYRILVSPVPRDYNIADITKHALFSKHIVNKKHINNSLIIEFDDKEAYEHCLSIGAFRIGENMMKIAPHTVVSDPDSCDINAENWYETVMLDHKPNIMEFIGNPQHPIFHYKWNADNWIQQFNKPTDIDQYSGNFDVKRHLLRVTVMLNTISIVKKKSYTVNNKEVILKSERLKTILYDHKSKLSNEKKVPLTAINLSYPSTSVKVIDEDCLIIYQKLASEGYRPLLLNMANATSPGGGYRKGDGAQEENLFRRSDYYQSLDSEVADSNRCERFYCTDKCAMKPVASYASLYPMEEFGAIYTSGITVFRQTESKGYAYMDEPLYNVCSIAMAAYREPELRNNNTILANKYAAGTYKKIENIFAIAHHHKHDCLVLSALGCGAFKNPPKHVASLFKAVIQKYAGFFKMICFAIVDDHNTGHRINPDGNLLPFQEILDNLIVQPSETIRNNVARGPNIILNKSTDNQLTLSSVAILDRMPCYHGAKCAELKNAQHNESCSHPSMCFYSGKTLSCDQMNDETHLYCFVHNVKCKYGGECNNNDPTHLSEFDHPDLCKAEGYCTDTHPDHLLAYRHLPLCKDSIKCMKYLKSDKDHCKKCRHCKLDCPFDNCCVNFHDREHIENAIHSFRTPCPFTPYNCRFHVEYVLKPNGHVSQEAEVHCLKFSHVCSFGQQCYITAENHLETSIHIARQLCPDREKCLKLGQEDHLETFSHPNIRDIRFLCKVPGFKCRDRHDDSHLKKFRHSRDHHHVSVAKFSGFNTTVDFVHNQSQLIRTVNNFAKTSNWKQAKPSREILDWIRALQPVHRCRKDIFESILVHGHVMSRHYMSLLKIPKNVANAVQQHSEVRQIFLHQDNPALEQLACELIEALVEAEFQKAGDKASGGAPTTTTGSSHDPESQYRITVLEKKLNLSLKENEMGTLRRVSKSIAEASIKLTSNPMGIGYNVDQTLGTDKQIFSILGPHCGYYYGEIVIIFKREIMLHPDTNFSIQAATSFGPSASAYQHRPWLTNPNDANKSVQNFHASKLHCSVPLHEYAAATELIALTGLDKNTMDVDLNAVIERWMRVDSHEVFESHLPQLIPLDYIDAVYIPKNLFESLNSQAQKLAKNIFGNSIYITEHIIDLNSTKPTVDAARLTYEKFVHGEIHQKINKKIQTPHTQRGTVITVASSKFVEQIVLPITISQSYSLYCLEKKPSDNADFTYIYWQAMHGDMMLTISNERIEPRKDQPNLHCLVCYVAKEPSFTSEDYYEAYSYLNDGHPYQHDANVPKARFKVKSNSFYRGCKMDDFYTFCLEISRKTGKVVLSHAGPNSIYNHEKIEYQFDKKVLDLSRIDYIHISAGTQDVPIRNLTINHERISELHPSFDKHFKKDTSVLLQKTHGTVVRSVHIPTTVDSHGASNANRGAHNNKPVVQINNTDAHGYRPDVLTKQTDSSHLSDTKPKSSWFGRAIDKVFCRSTDVTNPSSLVSNGIAPQTRPSSLIPCHDSVYCLRQNDQTHMEKYSHPCRFSELCRNQAKEPHLAHEFHKVPKCSDDENCQERTDPVHRARYRHTGLPDYLVPCHYQSQCRTKTSEHRMKYFHGENVGIKKG